MHNVHIFCVKNVDKYHEKSMKVHGIFIKNSEKNVNGIKNNKWRTLKLDLYPERRKNNENLSLKVTAGILQFHAATFPSEVKYTSGDDIIDKI